jgi:uncharacterized protein (DUF488 family)
MMHPFYTVGHSTRALEGLVELLQRAEVTFIADVRTVPRSRTNPQYNRDVLPDSLAKFDMQYEHLAALGGLRGRQRDVVPDTNAFWTNDSFHNYADYAMSRSFRDGLAHLRELGRAQRCAIMCAEAVWWRCHRRIIADYLISAGDAVFHILGPQHIEPAHMTEAAQVEPSGSLAYPA